MTDITEVATFPKLLEKSKVQLAAALPKHISADRMARIALTCFRMNPRLGACDPKSVLAAVVQASQIGLEPGLSGHAFLVPYKSNDGYVCQLVPGWRGLVDLVNRTGRASVWTGAVFEGDKFEFHLGDSPKLEHVPGDEDDPAKLTHVYAIGRVKGHDFPVIEVWTAAKVRKHRDRYNKVGKAHYSFEHWEMYARKVALLQVIKYMPTNSELEAAMFNSYAADSGITIDGDAFETPPAPDLKQEPLKARLKAAEPSAPSPGKAPTYAEIADKINTATIASEFDLCRDLIRSHRDRKQADELEALLIAHGQQMEGRRK